ncbi:MAG: hypothetical protein P1U56_07795 [Saprospiraceae bacterium]|nr:hypothetical protein [Saprospiraceae bacterium]
MLDKTLKVFYSIFTILWIVIIFSEYWRYNPEYGKAIKLFQYADLLIILVGIGAAISWFIKRPRKKPIHFINGLSIFFGLLILDFIAVNRFTAKFSGIESSGWMSHVAHIIGVAGILFLVYLLVRVIGKLFTTLLPMSISDSDLPIIQVAIGVMIFTLFMFFIGWIGLLNGFVLVPICLLILFLYWKHSFEIAKHTLISPIKMPENISVVGVFSFLFLAFLLIINFTQILRPFPIGADSLRLYVNLPSLLAEYGSLVGGYQPYNWSLFMSMGLTIFGRVDVVLGLSFLGGFLALIALFRLSRKWLDVNYSALVLLIFYSLPMVSFLSYMDMKIDMGLMFISVVILLLFYNWAKPKKREKDIKISGFGLSKARAFFKQRTPVLLKQNGLLIVMGLLAGFAFGIKLSSLFIFLSLIGAIWFFKGGKISFMASFFLILGAVFLLQLDAQPELRQFHENVATIQWSLLFTGIALLVYLFLKQKQKLIDLITSSLIIGSFFILPILPWMTKNLVETGNVSVTSLLNGKKASPIFNLEKLNNRPQKEDVIIPGVYQMPDVPEAKKKPEAKKEPEGKKDSEGKKKPEAKKKSEGTKKPETKKKKSDRNRNKAVSEDLHRFMGYEKTPIRYLSLPYDVFVKTNIPKFFTDVGYIILLLLPVLFLFPGKEDMDWKSFLSKFTFIGLSTLLLLISIPSAFLNFNNLSQPNKGLELLKANEPIGFLSTMSDSINSTFLTMYEPINRWVVANIGFSDSITYPLLILLFIILLSMVFHRIKKHNKTTQSTILFLITYFFLWWILGSGAPWYGILIFSIPLIFIFRNISNGLNETEENSNGMNWGKTIKKYGVLGAASIFILLAFVLRTTNYTPVDKQRAQQLYYNAILEYQMGNRNNDKLMDYHFPNVRQFVKRINRDKKSLVYLIGSPFMYFIDKNDSRVLSDTYMDFFDRLIQQYKTKDKVIAKLKEEGFTYIVFDLNMFSYDLTPEKTLTRKFINFMNTLYNNPGVELVSTDRKLKLYDSGEEVFAVFQDKGSILQSGTVAIFRIK